jgi:phosphohistidine phosphatase SixA
VHQPSLLARRSRTRRATQQRFARCAILIAVLLGAMAAPIEAQELAGAALVQQLRAGGFVLVMRHARSPTALPDAQSADPGNPQHERQLDESGKSSARAMGEALRQLHVPIAEVWTSPTFRALQTVKLAGLQAPKVVQQLGDGGQGMQSDASGSRSAWLHNAAATVPPSRSNLVIVTHTPNIIGAFGQGLSDLSDGESLLFRPDGHGGARIVARIKIDQWPQLASLK